MTTIDPKDPNGYIAARLLAADAVEARARCLGAMGHAAAGFALLAARLEAGARAFRELGRYLQLTGARGGEVRRARYARKTFHRLLAAEERPRWRRKLVNGRWVVRP